MRRLPLVLFSLVLGVACSDGAAGGSGPAGGGGTGGGAGHGGGGGACTGPADCGAGQLCDLANGQCIAAATCAGHAECGVASHCSDAGLCTPSVTGSACDTDTSCPPDETCRAGFCGCGGNAYSATKVPPNVLIVLDRSGSMNDDLGGGTKWDVARAAISELVAAYGSEIRFGLAAFPGDSRSCGSGQRCVPGAIIVDPGENTSGAIDGFLIDASTCSGGTPTAEMVGSLIDYAGLEDATRPNFVLLVTDGKSTCEDPIPQVSALRTEQPEVKTFVIGFGAGVDPTELEGMAQVGGTAIVGGAQGYYVAGDAAALAQAFSTIAGSIVSCSFALSEVPPDIDALYVYENQQPVLRDPTHAGGWDYDAGTNQITFFAAACDALQAGDVTDLTIVYGCPLELQ